MKDIEIMKLFTAIAVFYPNADWARNPSSEMITGWKEFLAPYSFEQVSAALKRHIVNSTYEPRIADLLTEMKLLSPVESRTEMTAEQAWALVLMAVKNSAYHSKREYDKLPADIKRRIGSSDVLQYWATVEDDGATLSVARANFLRGYGEDLKGRKMDEYMPSSVKALMQKSEPAKELPEHPVSTTSEAESAPVSNRGEMAQGFFDMAKKLSSDKKIK